MGGGMIYISAIGKSIVRYQCSDGGIERHGKQMSMGGKLQTESEKKQRAVLFKLRQAHYRFFSLINNKKGDTNLSFKAMTIDSYATIFLFEDSQKIEGK